MTAPSPYAEKIDELFRLADSEHVPPRVKSALSRLGESEKKLFCWMVEVRPAFGASEHHGSFQPSDFLCELVAAFRAFDWPRVIVLIHDALPKEGHDDSDSDLNEADLPPKGAPTGGEGPV